MKRKNMGLLMALTMLAMLACSLFTGTGTPDPTGMVETQMAMLPYTTVIRSTETQQPTIAPTITIAPTLSIRSTNTSEPTVAPQNSCMLWSEVTSAMAGEYICVRGNVFSTYQAEKGTYIRFSDRATSFYFMYLYQGNIFYYYPDLKIGYCVQAYGTIQAFQGIPRLEISGSLDYCD